MGRRWLSVGAAAAAGAAVVLGYRRALGPWQARWGATDEEAEGPLPGDHLVREPAEQATRAITIEAPPEDVWPWVAQIGADRGGFYSYDWLENAFGLGIHSADRIVPEWQERRPGDLVHADAAGRAGWYVMEVRPLDTLVLLMADLGTGRPARRDVGLRWEFLWSFTVRPGPGGTTRLLVRERAGFGSRLTQLLMAPLGLASFVMTRAMLRGVKARAEGRVAAGEAPVGPRSG